jgi:peptidoglycan hydrolase-like protein with peptidoglycan-binding domain
MVFRLLGYHMSENDSFTPADLTSIKIFQKMADLKVDGIVGQNTQARLFVRFETIFNPTTLIS